MRTKIFSLLAVLGLIAVSCAKDPSPGSGDGLTPLNVGVIAVDGHVQVAGRADDPDYLATGDELTVTATPKTTGTTYTCVFVYDKTADEWTVKGGETPLYVELLYDGAQVTHDFLLEIGTPTLVTDQGAPGAYHAADYVKGPASRASPTDDLSSLPAA